MNGVTGKMPMQNQVGAPPSAIQQMQQQQMMQQQMMALPDDMIGAIKIKDGLFIGDEFAAQDLEFVVANKVSHVINCAGRQIPNHWEAIGVVYLTFYWMDQENQMLFDSKDQTTKELYDFIESAVKKTESVLVHSVRGQSRAASVLAAYLMRKYRWSLLKTLEFLNSRRPELEIRGTFIQQLQEYEQRLIKQNMSPLSTNWTEISLNKVPGCPHEVQHEELILRNTFINAQMGPIAQYLGAAGQNMIKHNDIRWQDEASTNKVPLATEIIEKPHAKSNHKIIKAQQLKSCLKSFSSKISQQQQQQQQQTPQSQLQQNGQPQKNVLNFYQNPEQPTDNATLNENEGIDGGEIIFPQNNHHQLIKDQNIADKSRQNASDDKVVNNIPAPFICVIGNDSTNQKIIGNSAYSIIGNQNLINNNNINNFIINNPKIEIRQEQQPTVAANLISNVSQQNPTTQFSQLSGLNYIRNPLEQKDQQRMKVREDEDSTPVTKSKKDALNDSYRNKESNKDNEEVKKKNHKEKTTANNMINAYNPGGMAGIKLQNSKGQIGTTFNEISAGIRMIGQNSNNQAGVFRSGPIRATAFEQQYQNYPMGGSSEMQFNNIGSKSSKNTSQNMVGGRPGTAPKRPASPGANLNQKDQYGLGSLASQNLNSHSAKNRGGSQKPSSAPGKNRLRSNSPSTNLQQQEKKQTKPSSSNGFSYSNNVGQKHLGAHPLYRGYSPSKPKWKGGQQQQTFGQQAMAQSSAIMSGYVRQNSNKTKNNPY